MSDRSLNPRKIGGYAVRWLLPLALTVLLVAYMFRKVDFADMWHIMSHGVDYWWILLAMGISVLSHICRAARWRIQLRALGIDPPFMALCCSIFGTYALNLLFPRLGEVWRCTYIARREHAPFTEVLGSMIADRLADTVTVLLLTLLVFLIATPAIEAFLVRYPVGQGLVDMLRNPIFWIALVSICVITWAVFHLGRGWKPVARTTVWVRNMWRGFAVIVRMKGKWSFLFLTAAIWGCYYIQLYVAFFAFGFTRDLCRPDLAWGLTPCLGGLRVQFPGHGHPQQRRPRALEHSHNLRTRRLRRLRSAGHRLLHAAVVRPDRDADTSGYLHNDIYNRLKDRKGRGAAAA